MGRGAAPAVLKSLTLCPSIGGPQRASNAGCREKVFPLALCPFKTRSRIMFICFIFICFNANVFRGLGDNLESLGLFFLSFLFLKIIFDIRVVELQ